VLGADDNDDGRAAAAAAAATAANLATARRATAIAAMMEGAPDLYGGVGSLRALLRTLQRPFADSPLTGPSLKFPEPLEVLFFNFFFAQELRRFQRTMWGTVVATIGIILVNVGWGAHD
jgi:hypothetical protein